jgi:hypothetical protein
MYARERAREVLGEARERQIEGGAPADHHVVTPHPEPIRVGKPHDFPQSPPHPVAHDRIADLARYRKADPWRSCVEALAGLQHEGFRGGARPRRSAEKIRPFPQSFHGEAALARIRR